MTIEVHPVQAHPRFPAEFQPGVSQTGSHRVASLSEIASRQSMKVSLTMLNGNSISSALEVWNQSGQREAVDAASGIAACFGVERGAAGDLAAAFAPAAVFCSAS